MKKLFVLSAFIALIITVSSFSNTDNTQQILTVRINEGNNMGDESEILIAEPNQPIKDYGDLGAIPKEKESNLLQVTKCLNLIASKGWKLAAVACSNISPTANSSQLITVYTFTK